MTPWSLEQQIFFVFIHLHELVSCCLGAILALDVLAVLSVVVVVFVLVTL